MQWKSLLLFVLLCTPVIWFISGASRTGGVIVFASGVLVLGVAARFAASGFKKPLFIATLLLILAAMSLGLMEAVLWWKPDLLTGTAACNAFGGYHADPGGIYVRDRHLGYNFRPHVDRRIFWNGYWWRHQSGEGRYRGETVSKPDAVFLGDSMIYGHGVENDESVPSRFAYRTDLRTVNLGQQGTCLVQMAIRLNRIGRDWNPKYIFVCCHYNDIPEVTMWYPDSEMDRYVQSPADRPFIPSTHRSCWPRPAWRPQYFWNEHFALSLRSAAAIQYVFSRIGQAQTAKPVNNPTEFVRRGMPTRAYIDSAFAPWSGEQSEQIGWSANVRALKQIQYYCTSRGAELIVFDLGYPQAFSDAVEKTANEIRAKYLPTGQAILGRGLAGENVYLPNDGHWSPRGCELIAEQLADALH